MERLALGILILQIFTIVAIALVWKFKPTKISKIEPSLTDKSAENPKTSEIPQYLKPVDDPKILKKLQNLPNGESPTPSLLRFTAAALPQHLVNSAAYLQMGQLYRLDRQVLGTQMNYGSGIGSPVVGPDGKVMGHNSFMAMGVPWGLFLYQAGTIIFSAAHLAEISKNLKQINKKLEDLSYRFNFRSYSSSYGNYLLLQEMSGYLQSYHYLTDTHKTQLALIGKDLAADKIYYSQMVSRIDGIKNKQGAELREYVEQQGEALLMDIHGLYLTYYSSILYALLIGSEDAPQRVKEYNQAVMPYTELKGYIIGDEFKKLYLSNNFFAWLFGRKDIPKEQRIAYLQNFQESLPDMSRITKEIPSEPEIYVVRNKDADLLVYTPTD